MGECTSIHPIQIACCDTFHSLSANPTPSSYLRIPYCPPDSSFELAPCAVPKSPLLCFASVRAWPMDLRVYDRRTRAIVKAATGAIIVRPVMGAIAGAGGWGDFVLRRRWGLRVGVWKVRRRWMVG